LFAGVVMAAIGCGGTGTVTGKVTFKDKPLPGGLVVIYDSGGETHQGQIGTGGAYTVGNIVPGPAKVSVRTVKARGSINNPEGLKAPYGPYVQIPLKYSDPEKSGLKLDVKTGKQEYQIDLKGDFAEGEEVKEEAASP
jgi:hypothetical protein